SPEYRCALADGNYGPDQTNEFGFTTPLGSRVTVTLADGTEHVLILGGEDFSGSANYAVIDPESWPPEPDGPEYSVLVVNRDVANGINRPLEEWKMPVESPVPDTSDPSPSPSPEAEDPSSLQTPEVEDSDPDSLSTPANSEVQEPAPEDSDPTSSPSPQPSGESDTTN
ncbi:MAG: hypothetical protein HC929_10890, partial [Leptolyngbyaceae cyanobacterium SM2_5_2]|nr:hypothetical protein [Leptolyngbyaceae cyanobacterium SM2_5_2]